MRKKSSKIKNELEGIKIENMELVEPKKRKKKIHFYFGYNQRLACFIILFLIFLTFSLFFISSSIKIQKEKNVYYEESGTLDYKVYLKDNIYYDEKYLGKGMSYIANLIDRISIDFNYIFTSDTILNGEYYYDIVADLEIINPDNKTLFYSKQYDIIKEQRFFIENENNYIINENVNIDYDYYNSLANGFKHSYGVNAVSELKVYLELHRRIDEESVNNSEINGDGKIYLTIPLSENAINIKMDELDLNNQNVILSLNNYTINDYEYLIFGLISLIISIFIFIKIVKIVKPLQYKNNDYERLLNKILKQYDRLIVNTYTMPDFSNSKVTKVDSFFELLDAKDNLHMPIFYYEVVPHQKSYFFIKYDDNMIVYTLKNNEIKY